MVLLSGLLKGEIMSEKSKEMSKKIDRQEGIAINPSNTSVSVPASGFPLDLWKVWNKQCEKDFQGIRWVKMWSDHLKAQAHDLMIKSQFLIVEKNTIKETEEKEESLGLLKPEEGA